MSNHYHLVLHVNQALADSLSDEAVIARWRQLYKGPQIIQRYLDGESFCDQDELLFKETVNQWRDNLTNISRFMGNLNEHVARRANKEDSCKGRFWESRFKLQAILDLPALFRTLCYVDLNPVRAKMANNPETSRHTSVYRRLNKHDDGMLPFSKLTTGTLNSFTASQPSPELAIDFKDYLELLDWTGRAIAQGKRGSIKNDQPPIMARLGYTPKQWIKTQTPRVSWMQKAVGHIGAVKKYASAIGQRWLWQET